MLKKILPVEDLVYTSTLNKEALLLHLQNGIEAQKAFGIGAISHTYSKPYIGKIRNNTFEIKRVIDYRNSFLPQIKGVVLESSNGSKIHVKMSLPEIVKFFMVFWLGSVALGCIGVSYYLLFRNPSGAFENPVVFVPFAMLIFGMAMTSLAFKKESKKSIIDLEDLLQAKVIQQ